MGHQSDIGFIGSKTKFMLTTKINTPMPGRGTKGLRFREVVG